IALSGRAMRRDLISEIQEGHTLFAHFQIIPAWRELFSQLKVGTLVVDECHLAGIQNRRSLTIESIRFFNTLAKRVVFASGTPLLNKPSGLWSILDIVTPGAFGQFWSFARRYCDAQVTAYGWQAKGASNLDELKIRLREVMLRRTWKDVQGSLPAITRSVELVPLASKEQADVATRI